MSDKLFNSDGRPIGIAATELVKVTQNKTIAAAGDYAANDVISEHATTGTAFTFSGMARAIGQSGTIRRAKIVFSKASGMGTSLAARTRLRLYTATPTCNLNDNVANTGVLNADKANYVGYLDFPMLSSDGGSPEAFVVCGQSSLPLDFVCATNDTALYGVLTFLDAEANETASMICTIDLLVEQN
jgi:hypothetical protein